MRQLGEWSGQPSTGSPLATQTRLRAALCGPPSASGCPDQPSAGSSLRVAVCLVSRDRSGIERRTRAVRGAPDGADSDASGSSESVMSDPHGSSESSDPSDTSPTSCRSTRRDALWRHTWRHQRHAPMHVVVMRSRGACGWHTRRNQTHARRVVREMRRRVRTASRRRRICTLLVHHLCHTCPTRGVRQSSATRPPLVRHSSATRPPLVRHSCCLSRKSRGALERRLERDDAPR
jgi:hypothetical protein